MIRITSLVKRYGERTVLDVPSLTLGDGERCALIGANGSGKSTLLRILAGQLMPDGGEVAFEGIRHEEIGYLPQSPYAFDRTVLNNVLLAAGRDPDARERARMALERVGMAKLAHARGSRLSGGETQRMALARVLVRPWKLLLLDEPTSAADVRASDEIEDALLRYAEETRCTLVFATHAPGQASRLGRTVIALDGGRIVETGDVETVLRAPKSPEAQRLLHHWTV